MLYILHYIKAAPDKLVSRYEENYLLEKVRYVESAKIFQSNDPSAIAAYFVSAVNNDYKSVARESTSKSSSSIKFYDPNQPYEEENQHRQLVKHEFEKVIDQLNGLTTKERGEILSSFESSLVNIGLLKLYKEHGLDNPLVQDSFLKFYNQVKA